MSCSTRIGAYFSALFLLCTLSFAQQYPNAGFPLFSTQVGSQYDFIDLADGNISLSLPLRSIQAGPMPLSFSLFGASNAYLWDNPSTGNTTWAITTPSFSFLQNVGANLSAYSSEPTDCNNEPDTVYTNISVTDANGTVHPLNPNIVQDSGGCDPLPSPPAQPTIDGSGYTFVFTGFGLKGTLYDKFGNTYNTSYTTGGGKYTYVNTVKTPDGVTGSTTTTLNGTGCAVAWCTTVADALTSTPVISYQTPATTGGSMSYSYTNAQGNIINPPYTVNYTAYTQVTNFGCSGITEYGPLKNQYLPTSITTPTGGKYTISYETTPNYSSKTYPPPYTTGRIASITLPSGGSISYTYGGGSNGVNCTSGVIPTLIRTVNDNNGNVGKWTYVNSNSSLWSNNYNSNFTVAVTDPANNQTAYNFQGQFQTQASSYQGGCPTTITGCNGGGTLLKATTTCYNGVFANCAQPTAGSITGPPYSNFSQTDVYTSYNGGTSNLVEAKFDTYGNTTEVKQYDFGAAMPPTGSPLSDTLTYYGQSWNGSSCAAYPSGVYIYTTPCYSYTKNSVGTTVAQTKITYNNDGTGASSSRWTGATENTWLTTSFGYGANGAAAGVLSSVTDVNNATTTYGSFACNGMLPGSTTYPLSSVGSSLQTWNCNGGVVTSTIDPNNQTTNYSYNDPLWRQTEVANPDGGITTTTYNTGTSFPWTIATCSTINTSSSCPSGSGSLTGLTELDGLQRVIQKQLTSDPNGTSYVSTTYDVLGRVASTSNPYYTSGDPTYGVTSYAYDALGRVITVTNPDTSQRLMAYSGAWANIQDEGNGTNRIIKLYQRDGLGRLITVCEVTSATQQGSGGSPVSCGAYGAYGFLSTYSYDALGNITYMTQGAQNRTFTYDGLARLTVDANPEAWGPTTYTYDATEQQGDLYQRSQPKQNLGSGNGNWTATYTFDALHRKTGVSYNDGTTPSGQWIYDSSDAWGKQGSHTKGRLVATRVNAQNGGALIAGEGFITYDPMGRVQWRLQNGQGSEYDLNYTYDYLGDVLTATNSAAVTFTSTYNTAAELSGVTSSLDDANHPANLFEGPQYNALGQVTTDNLGFLNEHYGYTNRGWLFSYWACTVPGNGCSSSQMAYTFNMQPPQGGLGFAPNGDIVYAGDWINGNWTYSYDNFNRLSSSSCAGTCPGTQSALGFNYLYDRFGNRWQQNATAGSGPQPQYTFDGNNHIYSGGVYYDAAGNMTGDSSHSYIYNAENRVVQVDGTSGQCSTATACYVYNASGQRVSKTTSAGTVYDVYDIFGHQVAEFSSSGAWNRGEVYAGSKHLATYVGGTSGSTYLDLADWVGTERMRVNSNQSSQETCTGLPFGDMQSCTGTDESPMHFTGQQWDSEDNLTAFWFRSNSTTQGRWSAMDPAGMAAVDPTNPQTWNRYAYVTNNPVSFTDPTGLGGPGSCSDSASPAICQGGWGIAYLFGGTSGWDSLTAVQTALTPTILPATEVGTLINYGELSDTINVNSITYTPNEFTYPNISMLNVINFSGFTFGPANNGQQQQQQTSTKKPCTASKSPAGTIPTLVDTFSRITHPLDLAAVNASMFVASGGLFAAGGLAISGGCLEPTPGEPLTCAAGIFGGVHAFAGGTVSGTAAVLFFKNYTLPAFKNWGCED